MPSSRPRSSVFRRSRPRKRSKLTYKKSRIERYGIFVFLILSLGKRSAVYGVSRDNIQHRAKRNAYEHAHNAHGIAADRYGNEHPYARKSDGFADDLGIDEIALKLLKDNDEHNKPHCLDGFYQQYQERADGRSDKRAEHGDERREADEHGYRRSVGR